MAWSNKFNASGREYILLGGPIEAAAMSVLPFCEQSASMWWPRDRAWCVTTVIDMMWTFVGGAIACIEELLAAGAWRFTMSKIDDRADINGDKINM